MKAVSSFNIQYIKIQKLNAYYLDAKYDMNLSSWTGMYQRFYDNSSLFHHDSIYVKVYPWNFQFGKNQHEGKWMILKLSWVNTGWWEECHHNLQTLSNIHFKVPLAWKVQCSMAGSLSCFSSRPSIDSLFLVVTIIPCLAQFTICLLKETSSVWADDHLADISYPGAAAEEKIFIY